MPFFRNIARDDTVLRRLRPRNLPVSDFSSSNDRLVTVTALFFVKCAGETVSPPVGLREKQPYINADRAQYKKVLWWKEYSARTLYQVRVDVAKYVDRIAHKITSGYPIAALRVVLIDWATGEPIPTDILGDFWYFTSGFANAEVDDKSLRAWGIPINVQRDTWDDSVKNTEISRLRKETLYKALLPECIDSSVVRVISELPKKLKNQSVLQTPSDQVFTPIDMRRIIVLMRSRDTRKRLHSHLMYKYVNNEAWRDSLGSKFVRRRIEKETQSWLWDEIGRLLAPKLNMDESS